MFEKKIKKLLLLVGLIFFLSTDLFNVFSDTTRVTNGEDIGVVIVGTITNTDPKNNVALIKETATGKVKAVKLGYTVAAKYKVIMVEKKYIITELSNHRIRSVCSVGRRAEARGRAPSPYPRCRERSRAGRG